MLKKDYRLSKSKDIDFTYKSKFQYKHQLYKLFLRRNLTNNFKLLIVVSKKVFSKSVDRNKIRRRISAIFESLKFNQRLPPSVSLIILVNSPLLEKYSKIKLEGEILPKVALLFKNMLNAQQTKSENGITQKQ